MGSTTFSASYVLDHFTPTLGELQWGLAREWIKPADCVAICLAKMNSGAQLEDVEERVGLLLSDELEEVSAILGIDGQDAVDPEAPEAELWKYLAVRQAVDTLPGFEDQLEAFADLWCDFDHDAELAGLVRFLPPPEGAAVGLPAMKQRLDKYLADSAEHLKDNRP